MTWSLDSTMGWDFVSGPTTLSFFTNAVYLLQQDGSRATDPALRARAAQIYQQVAALQPPTLFSNGSSSEEVINLINLYDQLRADLDRAHLIYSAPPVDVAFGSGVYRPQGTAQYPAPLEAEPDLLYQNEHQANTLLQNGDPLRVAIIQWAAWWRGLRIPDTLERTRARRLAAWSRDRITALTAQMHANAPPAPPVAPPHMPGQQGGPTPAPPAPQAAPNPNPPSRGSNDGVVFVGLAVLAVLAWNKRRRR